MKNEKNMKNISLNIILLLTIFSLLYFSLEELKVEQNNPVVYDMPEVNPGPVIYPQWEEKKSFGRDNEISVRIPQVGRDFVGFKEALAFNESGRRYHIANDFGYLGKYQFGMATLRELNMHVSKNEFLKNPQLQEEAFKRYIKTNRKILAKEIERFSGKYINGIKITESGILAAAHLAGAGAVKKFLYSGGNKSSKDAFGTRIEDYLRKFGGYDLDSL